MAKIIAITNQKGGVAKTTNALNLADAIKHLGHKVLFIDMDPQGNSTAVYGAASENVATILDVLKGDCTAEEAVQHTALGDIIAGDKLLNQEEMFFNSQKARETILKRRIKNISEEYEYIFIDTPPNLGIYMVMSLTAADGCVVSIKAEKFAIDGLSLLIETVNDIVETLNQDLHIYGVLLSIYDKRNSLDKQIYNLLPELGEANSFKVFKTPIRTDQNVKNIQALTINDENIARSLFELAPKCNAAQDYMDAAKELLEVIKKNG